MIDPTITTALIRQTWASMRLSEFMRFLNIRDRMICRQDYPLFGGAHARADLQRSASSLARYAAIRVIRLPAGACTGRDLGACAEVFLTILVIRHDYFR